MKFLKKYHSALTKGSSKATSGKGKGLSVVKVDDYIKFMVFLAAIGVFYIWNSHQAEKQVKLKEAYFKEVKRLKSNYLLKEATLSADTRLSQISEKVDTLGLRPLKEPAFKIVRNGKVDFSKKPDGNLQRMNSEPRPPSRQVHAER